MSSIERAPRGRRGEGGFTLLEVMCAFAILAIVVGFLTQQYFHAVERGTRALHLRELREAADTVFRKIIYEEQNFHDGDGKTLDVSYADWAQLKGYERDRWRVYRWALRKERMTAAGQPNRENGEEPIFGSSDDQGTTTSTSSRDRGTDEAAESQVPGQALWRMTVSFYNTDDTDDVPLLVLRTYIPVREEAKMAIPRAPTAPRTGGAR